VSESSGRSPIPPWVILLAILLVTAVWSVFPLITPRTPGTLQLGVVAGEDPAGLRRAFGPLAAFLGPSVRRSGEVRVVSPESIEDGTHQADLLLVVADQRRPEDHVVLAWTKPTGRVGIGAPWVLVSRVGPQTDPARWALGDRWVLGGAEEAREFLSERGVALDEEPPVIGTSPYRHDEVIALLRHGAVDRIVVCQTDLERATASGRLHADDVRVETLGSARPRFSLVAGPSLSEPARRRLRARALDLDVLRLNPRAGVAATVAASMAQFGLSGFAPIEPFPSLRP